MFAWHYRKRSYGIIIQDSGDMNKKGGPLVLPYRGLDIRPFTPLSLIGRKYLPGYTSSGRRLFLQCYG